MDVEILTKVEKEGDILERTLRVYVGFSLFGDVSKWNCYGSSY